MDREDTESALTNRVDARYDYYNLHSNSAKHIFGELNELLNENFMRAQVYLN